MPRGKLLRKVSGSQKGETECECECLGPKQPREFEGEKSTSPVTYARVGEGGPECETVMRLRVCLHLGVS